MMRLPNRNEIKLVLNQLISDEISRDVASRWALKWVLSDDEFVEDKIAWNVLTWIGNVDQIALARPFLYGKEDFEKWLAELEK